MNQNQVLLATEEQALSNAISQLGACIHQDVQFLAGLDVGVQSTVVQGLTAKVQEQLRQYRSLLGDLQHAAEEQETPEQTQRVAYVLGKHQSDYDSIHKAFQDARIHFQRRKEQSYVQQQRQELIGSVDFSQRQQKFASEQEAVLGAQDVTASLRRTRQLMAQNLEQTHGNISVIASSNKRLQSAGDELTGQKDIFKESHGLLGTLKTQSLLDKFAMWGGFTFFMLVVLYISFKRTPAFMKQPLYSLLHMKPTGKPFDHQDYAAANIPPGTFKPSDQPWAAAGGDGGGEQAYSADWAAWDANFADMPGHDEAVYKDSDWQELLNEGLQQETGESWQRAPDGSLRPLQQRMAPGEPGAPGMSDQEQQASDTWGCSAADGDASCHGGADSAAAGFQAGQQATAAPIHVTKAQFDTKQQQQQQHDDEDELAFQSGAAYHPSDENASDQHIDVHWTAQQQQQQQPEWHGSQPPPAALGIIDPEAAAVAAGSDTAAADYQQDPDELEYQVKQQQQQVEEVVPPAQQQQHLQLQQQQQKEEQQQQQQQEQQTAEAYAEEPVATEFVAQAPDLAAPDALAAPPDESKLPLTPAAADDSTAASAPTDVADTSSSQEAVSNTAQDSAAESAPTDIPSQPAPAPAADVTGDQQQADISNDQQQAPSDIQPEQQHSSSPAVQEDLVPDAVTSEEMSVGTGGAIEPPSEESGQTTVGDLEQVLQQFEAPTTENESPQTPAAEGDSMHNAPVDQQPAAEQQQQQREKQEQQQEQMLVSAGLQTSDEVVGEPQQQQQQQDQEIPPVTSGGHSSSTESDVATTEQQQQQPGPVESQADITPDATDSAADTLTQQQQQDLQEQEPPPSLAVDAAASGVSDDILLQQGGGEVTTSAQPDNTAPSSTIEMLLDHDAVPTEQESNTAPVGVQQQQKQHLEAQQQTPEQPAATEPVSVEEATPAPVTEVTDNTPTAAADAAVDDAQRQQQKQQQDSNADQVPHDMPHTPIEHPEVDDRTVESASSDTFESSSETWESLSSSHEPDATVVIEELTHAPAGEVKVLDEQRQDQQQQQQQQESTINVDKPEPTDTQTVAQQEQQKQHEQESFDIAAKTADSATDNAPIAVPTVSTLASEEAASVAAQQVAAGLSAAAADIVASVQPELDTVGLNAKVQQAIQAKGQKFLSKLRYKWNEKHPASSEATAGSAVSSTVSREIFPQDSAPASKGGAAAAESVQSLSELIEQEQKAAFSIMDMDDVGLYHYDETAEGGNKLTRRWTVDGLGSAADEL